MKSLTTFVAGVALVWSVLAGSAHAQRLTPEEMQAQFRQLEDASPDKRIEAVEVLGRRGWSLRRDIAPRLQRLLREDPDWRVRASSGRAIGRLSVRTAVPDLVAALRDPQVEVRVVAAAALWRLPDPAAVPGLVELLNDRDAAARQWGALALGVVRDRRATQPLLRVLVDPEGAVRMDVIRSLGRIGDPTALEPLRDFARTEGNAIDERLEAVNSIASLDSPDKVNVLVQLLGDSEERVRLRSIRALGQVGDALAIPPLRRVRQAERSEEVRGAIDEAVTAIQERASEQRAAGMN
ncbi:MAG: HEAT repeat domain-containing protein [Sandaracinus sp.]|nr:HEAT repeat domain-containing protein [Sandaracinus sp.]MCB9615453.1 HEAT repeat domain-containing protein [Sandaracinus sp.]MCB9622616.1 HEAT repeat domain-containing protein [Sandaracinus sp.]